VAGEIAPSPPRGLLSLTLGLRIAYDTSHLELFSARLLWKH